MKTTMHVIYAAIGKKPRVVDIYLPVRPSFDVLKDIVIPHLGEDADMRHDLVYWNGRYTSMFTDDRGVARWLPVNEAATDIMASSVTLCIPSPVRERGHQCLRRDRMPPVLGTAVLFSRVVMEDA